MEREIVWERVGRLGLEHLVLRPVPGGHVADGVVLADPGQGCVRLRYTLDLDAGWRVLTARLALDRGDGRVAALRLDRSAGGWTVDGQPRPDLAGCQDIDIAATPFTNTLMIRQLALPAGVAVTARLVYIRVPDLTVEMVEQAYTCLDGGTPPRLVRYQGLATGFTADLVVDGDGLVTDYPGIWRRRAGLQPI